MLFVNRFQSQNGRKRKVRRRPTHRNSVRHASFPPRFESLEYRAMLTTFTVTNLDDVGDGSLRDAIDDANMAVGADVIEFAPNVKGTIGLASELEISDDLTINGPGQGELTISGLEETRVFKIGAAVVQIDHLTISDGLVDAGVGFPVAGGAIFNSEGELSLDHVVMSNNAAIDAPYGGGGAIFSISGTLHVSNSSFENNRATNATDATDPVAGGAIANVLGTADISHSSFTDNEVASGESVGLGGAISNTFNGTLEVNDSHFQGNSVRSDVDARGGAISVGFGGGAVTVENSQFVGNFANGDSAKGGAIWVDDVSSFELDQSSIVNNELVGTNAEGGGIYNAGSFTLTSSNVNANRTIGDGGDGVGGGIYNVGTFEIDNKSYVDCGQTNGESSSVPCSEFQAGDANVDGRFNQLDIVQVMQAGKYNTGEGATWRDGDWNLDGLFDQADIIAALQAGNYAA